MSIPWKFGRLGYPKTIDELLRSLNNEFKSLEVAFNRSAVRTIGEIMDVGLKSTAFDLDLSTGLTHQIQLGANAIPITLLKPTAGSRYRVWLQQDVTGSRTFPVFKVADGNETVMYTNDVKPVLTTTPGAMDLFELEYRSSPTARFTCITLQTNVLLPTPVVESVTATTT